MRATLTSLAEAVGIVLISVGCWMVVPAAGLISAGVGLVAIGVTQA